MSGVLWPKTGSPLAPTFEFDILNREDREDGYEWPEKNLEDGANFSDFGAPEAKQFTLQGLLTATPWGQPYSLDRVANAYAALIQQADLCEEWQFIGVFWQGTVVITKGGCSYNADQGEKADVTISMKTISRAVSQVVGIPPARLKPKVRKGASSAKAGGGSAGKPAGSKSSGRASQLFKGNNWLGTKLGISL